MYEVLLSYENMILKHVDIGQRIYNRSYERNYPVCSLNQIMLWKSLVDLHKNLNSGMLQKFRFDGENKWFY